jgi:hypothetical protein
LLDQYFYVGQKLKIPIKEQPKVESSNYTYSSSSWEESKPVRKQRSNNGWKQFWNVVGSAFAAGFTGYGQPMMYNPYSYQGGGNMDYLIDPNYTLMQVQQQRAQEEALNQQLINLSIQQTLQQEQLEFQQAKQWRPDLTIEQFRMEKGQAIMMAKEMERQ